MVLPKLALAGQRCAQAFVIGKDRSGLACVNVVGYRRGVVIGSLDLAGVWWSRCDLRRAHYILAETLDIAADMGFQQAISAIFHNAGELHRQNGDVAEALRYYSHALKITHELGEMPGILDVLGNLSIIYTQAHHYPVAEQLHRQAIELGREMDIPYVVCEELYHLAQVYTHQHKYETAEATNQEAADIVCQIDRHDILFQTQVLAQRLHATMKPEEVTSAIVELRGLISAESELQEQALVEYTIWQIDRSQEDARQRAATLYDELLKQMPNDEYWRRYMELSGKELPPFPPLPTLNSPLLDEPVDIVALLGKLGITVDPEEARIQGSGR